MAALPGVHIIEPDMDMERRHDSRMHQGLMRVLKGYWFPNDPYAIGQPSRVIDREAQDRLPSPCD